MASERVQRRIERLLDQLDEAESQGNWESVRDLAQDVLEIDSDNTEAGAYLQSSARRLGAATASPSDSPSSPPDSTVVSDRQALQPTAFANGRYQVKRFLGEGGKKKVYLAHDTTLDREVAFALIKSEGLDETSRARIQREAQAMGRLGSHAHIVTVFDLGEENGQPYMVTELMGGGDVEGVIEDAEDHRLPLEQAIKIAQETCRGMEFAHSRGIVHRDLKPGNVWLTSDGIAKIGDFGLAVALDRSRLTTEGMMVGTVCYMPPEQAMGGEVTPRSDLYSLGAMLYEMVTGRPPFLGDDSVAMIGQHINTPPVAPTWHNGQCPRALDALILRLLAKDPSERPESATDVLCALDAIDLDDADVGAHSHAPLQDNDPHALDSLAGGVFVGRQKEMGDLKACLEDALSGRGRLVTLVGEPGIGKTRIAQELATYAGLRGAQVLWGRSYEEQGVPPYWPWVQAIRSYVREKDPQQLHSEMGSGAADIAEVVSDVRDRIPGLPPAPQLEPEQARFRLFDSISTFLKTASHRQPLVLVLDDLHWADQPSLALLQFVARELSGARLLIIGTYRDMELSRQHPLAEALGELTRERLFQRVLLRRLTQEDVGRFIEMTSGNAAPRGLAEAVHTQTEGNPLFVTEVVRLLVQEGELGAEQVRETDSWTIRIPEGVREVIGRRLNRLSQRCNEALTVASIVGREFTLDQVKPLVEELTEDRLFDILEEALAARVIEELPQSVGRYQFTHALIQETLTAELSLTRRVRLHARIAETLEEMYGDNADAHAAELAHHFAQAEAVTGPEKIVKYSLMAGDRALTTYAWEEALSHFRRGIYAKGTPMGVTEEAGDAEEAELIFGVGKALAGAGDRAQLQEAVDTVSRAFYFYIKAGEEDKAVAVAAYPLPSQSGARLAMAPYLSEALKLVEPDSLIAGRLLCSYGAELGRVEADYDGAQKAFARALEISQQLGDTRLEARTLAASSNVDQFHMRLTESLSKSLRAIELAHELGDPLIELHARLDTARGVQAVGEDVPEMLRQADAALDLAERIQDHYRLALACRINATLHRRLGDWEKARAISDRVLAVGPRDITLLGDRLMLESEVGDIAQGRLYLERVVDIIRQAPARAAVIHMMGAMTILCAGYITGTMDYEDVAAETVLSSSSAEPAFARAATLGLAYLAVHQGDATAAGQHYQAFRSDLYVSGAVVVFDSRSRLLGNLARTMGLLDEAVEHFETALAFSRGVFQPDLAWICCDYSDMLRERDAEGDRAKAIALLDESLTISSELGMRPLMERVLSRREILKA
jgi:tetratricopeptide (TPR) repeat protein